MTRIVEELVLPPRETIAESTAPHDDVLDAWAVPLRHVAATRHAAECRLLTRCVVPAPDAGLAFGTEGRDLLEATDALSPGTAV